MKILAIDPSLTNTAVLLGDAHNWDMRCVKSCSSGGSAADRNARYQRIIGELDGWLREEPIHAIYLEGYSYGSKGAAVTSICEFGGILRSYLLDTNDAPLLEVAPTTLKKFCTGKGAGKKEMVIAHLMKRYDVEFKTNDEFDAYGLYRLGLVAEGLVEAANQAQQEAVDTVLGRAVKKAKKKRTPGSVPPRDEVYRTLKAASESLKTGGANQ